MAEAIRELLVTEAAAEKLAARNISEREVEQLVNNRYALVPNRRGDRRGSRGRRGAHEPGVGRLLIGLSDGGRALTLVIERTVEPTAWLVVTGWNSTKRERKMLGS